MTALHPYLSRMFPQHQQPLSHITPADNDELQEPPSLSSSPASQQSALHPAPNPPTSRSTTGHPPANAIPRSVETNFVALRSSLGDGSGLMNTRHWNQSGHQLHPNHQSRINYDREESLSTQGSAGPTSPFNPNVANPRVAVAEPGAEGLHGFNDIVQDSLWDNNYVVQSKPPVGGNADAVYAMSSSGDTNHNLAHRLYPMANMSARPYPERNNLISTRENSALMARHGADPVESPTIECDYPAMAALEETLEDRRRRGGFQADPPKLDRTMTDTYNDTAYIPNLNVTSPHSQKDFSPSVQFSKALEAANMQHLNPESAAPGLGYRESSPFRNGSPLAPTLAREFGGTSHLIGAAPRSSHTHLINRNDSSPSIAGHTVTPQTISPKDSILEFEENEADGQYSPPLFPQHRGVAFDTMGHFSQDETARVPGTAEGPLQPVIGQSGRDSSFCQGHAFTTPTSLITLGGRQLASTPRTPHQIRTEGVEEIRDDGGTYSCTYHGCDLRFDSQKELQAHKREGHRSAGSGKRGEKGLQQQSQHGPHTCTRRNPSTGKICGSKFSRPYDLTRHEDTIHNARKQKVRCDICTEEKLFSRRDALSRHFKVCHEELFEERFGRGRRRRG